MSKPIPLFKVHMPESVLPDLTKTLKSGFIGQGPKVEEFERKLSEFIGNPYALTLNSATSGLQLALRLANVGAGDEVISTAMTCTATNMPILAAGAKIVWADVDPVTGNLSPKSVEQRITPKTKAILMVHWGGTPCEIDKILAVAKKRNIKVIEDAAHAFGAEYKGKKIGNHSDFVVFSFQAIKHITTVDGGALFCRSESDYKRGKLLRWYGIDRESDGRSDFRCESDIPEWGYKFHMNDVAATIGIEQMKHIENILKKHRSNAQYYEKTFSNTDGVRTIPTKEKSAHWLYTVHVDQRDSYMEFMKEHGIVTSKVHNRNDIHTTFQSAVTCPMPGLEEFFSTMVSIPVGWWITNEDRARIAELTIKFQEQIPRRKTA